MTSIQNKANKVNTPEQAKIDYVTKTVPVVQHMLAEGLSQREIDLFLQVTMPKKLYEQTL